MPWNVSPLAVCSNFNAMNDLGLPLLFDDANCICYSPCDYEHDPSHYQFDQCPFFMGGLHWNGCKMWLQIVENGSGTCAASDRVSSDYVGDSTPPSDWRFYDDLAWRAANDASPAQTMNGHPLVASEEYPDGPVTGEEYSAWNFDFVGLSEHYRPSDPWFNQVGDSYYYRIRHDARANAGCGYDWLGFDSASCTAAAAEVDAVPVGASEAPMIKFTLH